MTTPASPNQISLTDVQTEFGGTNPIEIAEYYAGGSYVPATVSGVPTSGVISLDDLRGKTKIVYAISLSISPNSGTYPYTSTITWTSNLPVSGYVNLIITYPNGGVNNILTNQPINGTAQVAWGGTVGVGNGSIYATGYSSVNTLLATSNTVNYTISAPPTYAFGTIPTSINEGTYRTFNVNTTNVTNGTYLYWIIDNISTQDADFQATNGSFVINSNTGSFDIIATADITTEGPQTFRVTVRTNSASGPVVATSDTVTIIDTSIASYSLTTNKSAVNEGDNFTITFTTNQPGSFPYTISGVGTEDIGYASMSGSLSNGNQITFTATADNITDASNPETFVITLNNGLASASVNIFDTSQTPYYTFTRSTDSVNEGGSFYIDFATNQSGYFNYTITGVTSDDLNGSPLTGSINSPYRLNYTVKSDSTTEGTETFTIRLNDIPSTTASVTIYDTSQTPFYTLTPSATSVNEGGNFNITFTTNQGGSYYYSIRELNNFNSADIGGAALTGVVSNGDVLTYNVTADSSTEGTEYFEIQITGNTNGNSILPYSASATVTINDTSQTPVVTPTITSFSSSRPNEYPSADVTFNWATTNTNYVVIYIYDPSGNYVTNITSFSPNGSTVWAGDANRVTGSWRATLIAVSSTGNSTNSTIYFTIVPVPYYIFSRSNTSVNEGGYFYYIFYTNQPGSFPYTISGVDSADISGASLTGYISNGGVVSFTAAADNTTEGTEILVISLDNGLARAQTVIYDTSQTPAVYSFSRSTSAVNEGDSFYVDFSTNQSGSFYYSISGVSSADINNAGLDGYVSNGSRLYFTTTADSTTEGTETFTISSMGSSTSVTIYDTSTSPIIPTITNIGTNRPNAYNTADVTITWGASNASYVYVYVYDSNGTNIVGFITYNTSNTYTYSGSASRPTGTYTLTVTAVSSTGNTASQTQYFTVIQAPIYPSFNSYSLSSSNTLNTNNVTANWSTSNATSVDVQVTFPSGTVVTANNQSANASEFVLFYGSSSNQIGQYTVALTARSSTNNTTTVYLNFTYTAPATFSANFSSFYSTGATGSSSVTFNEAGRNIVINGNGTFNLNASGYATYTTTATGYLYCFLYVGTEQYWDYGYFYLDGAVVQDTTSISGVYKNGSGGYSGGPAYVLNNYKVGPISAGTHTIQIRYTNDYAINPNGDVISGAWTWSAT